MQIGSIVHYNGTRKEQLLKECQATGNPVPQEHTDYMVTALEPKQFPDGAIRECVTLDTLGEYWYVELLFDEVVPPFPIVIEETKLEVV